MDIILIGASGRIGRAIDTLLNPHHHLIRVGSRSGDIICDYSNPDSARTLFTQVGPFDALICVAGGDSLFKPYSELTDDDYRYGFERKIVNQIRLVDLGQHQIRDGGSFTLTTGFLSNYPNPTSLATGLLNSALDTYVAQRAPYLERNVRINTVSPAPVVEPEQLHHGQITAEQVAQFYHDAITSDMTGTTLRAWGGLENDRAE